MKIINLTTLQRRDSLGYWLNDQGLLGTGVEIGCMFGAFARQVLTHWKGKKYFMVDPWIQQDPTVYREKHSDVNFDGCYRECQKLAKEDPRVELIRAMSVQALPRIEDASLDFAYIDGNHAYREVLEDMDGWWNKVKVGGVLCGHDYYDDTNYPHYCQVYSAVRRWADQHQSPYLVTPCSSWWIAKL